MNKTETKFVELAKEQNINYDTFKANVRHIKNIILERGYL